MTKDLSRDIKLSIDIKLSKFLNVSWLIILTELPQSIKNSTGRALLNVNIVFSKGLLIVKQYSSLEELPFYNKLTGIISEDLICK